MVYDLWNLALPTLPPRSRLYSLAPMGIGSSQVESLTSYVMRLAEAHAVSPGTLIRQEIFPNLLVTPKRPTFGGVHSLNGMGSCFEQWVSLLEQLTARRDLRQLTLLHWNSALACAGVLRRHRAWCPRCYQEWRDRSRTTYEPLLWTLAPVTICPTHEVSLEKHCPHCRQRLLLLSARARPGFCTHCNGWLGDEVPISVESKQPTEDERWVARAVGELLALGTATLSIPPHHLRNNLQRATQDWANGNRLLFCRVAKISDKTLVEWLNGDYLPSLPLLIRVSQNLRVPPSRLLLEEIATSDPIGIQARQIVQAEQRTWITHARTLRLRPAYPVTRNRLWELSPEERGAAKAEIKACLEASLDQDIPRSVRDIFRGLGYRRCVMGRFWFPELCAAIKAKRKQRFDRYQQELRTALNEAPPPTVAQVAQRLGTSLNILRKAWPELCTALSACYPDRQRFQNMKTEEALKRALKEPPVPLTNLAPRLHRDANKLRVAFPDLSRRLRERYIAHRSSELQKIHLVYEKEVRQAIEEITAASKYPSRKRVLSLLSERNPSLTSVHLTSQAIRRIREELQQITVPPARHETSEVATMS